MRIRISFLFSLVCLLAMSVPVWGKNLSSNFQFDHVTKLASTQLEPGTYRFVANESNGQMQVLKDNKVVAKVKGTWVSLSTKSPYAEVLSTRHDIQEVRFAGQKKAIKFTS